MERRKTVAEKEYERAMYLLETAPERPDYLKEALRLLKSAAGMGSSSSQLELAKIYLLGELCPKDPEGATELLLLACRQGELEAHFILADCFRDAIGVPRNYEAAVKHYRVAHKKGYSKATYNLAICHRDGLGIEKDLGQCIEMYKLAAKAGIASAEFNLATLHLSGEAAEFGVPLDKKKAVKLFNSAAENGHTGAMYTLAEAYRHGPVTGLLGLARSDSDALALYKTAAKNGHEQSKELLKEWPPWRPG